MNDFLYDILKQLNRHKPWIRAVPDECGDETIAVVLIVDRVYNSAGKWEKITFFPETDEAIVQLYDKITPIATDVITIPGREMYITPYGQIHIMYVSEIIGE